LLTKLLLLPTTFWIALSLPLPFPSHTPMSHR
jgi:hypothetical protein